MDHTTNSTDPSIRTLSDGEFDAVNGGAIPLIVWAAIGFAVGFHKACKEDKRR